MLSRDFANYPGGFLCLVKGNRIQRLGSMGIGNGGVGDA